VAARLLQTLSIPDDAVRLSADTLSYGIGKAGEGIAMLVLLPVLTRAFSPAEFGVWDVTMTFFMLTAIAASLGLEPALAAFSFETRESDRRKLIAATAIHFRLISSAALAILILLFAPGISLIIFRTADYATYFRILAVAVPLFSTINIFKQLLRLDFSPWKFNIIGVGYAACYAGLAVFLVTKMKMGVAGVLVGILVSAACFSIVGGAFTARHFSLKFSGPTAKEMLRFGLPLLPSLFACWLIDFSDRYFLTRMATLEQVGIYSVGARISSIVILFSTSFQMAWGPYALSIQHHDDAKERYSRGLLLFVCAALAGATAITIFARPILVVLAQPRYYAAEKVIGLLVLATVAYGAYLVANIGLLITKKTILTSSAIAIGALLNIVLNFLLIPRFGMMGAAVATLAAYSTAFVLLYMVAQKHYPINYRPGRLAGVAILSMCTMAVSSAVRFDTALIDFTFRILLFIGYLLLLLRIFIVRTDQA
jgi:O-antigen/teichoic acid export membrane protein